MSAFSRPAAAAAQTTSLRDITISGAGVLAMYEFDICSAVSLGNCPISLEFSEQYSQPVTIQTQLSAVTLNAGEMESTQVELNPGQPFLELGLGFSIGTDSYNYSAAIPLPFFSNGAFTYSIPLTQVIAGPLSAGLPISPILVNLANLLGFSLDLPISLETLYQTDIGASGFMVGTPSLRWSGPGTESFSASLTGTAADSYLAVDGFESSFVFNASLVLSLPVVGQTNLISFQTPPVTFGSSGAIPIGDWYHVDVTTPYSEAQGSGWYLSGSTVSVGLTQPQVGNGSSQYQFNGWAGTGAGSYSGTDVSPTLTVSGPITETATWNHVGQASPFGPIVGGYALGIGAAVTFIGIMILGVIGGVVLLVVRQRKPTPW